MAFKIKSFKEAGINEKEDRFVIVATNGKILCSCSGKGFLSKESAYYGFKVFSRRYREWKKYQKKTDSDNEN